MQQGLFVSSLSQGLKHVILRSPAFWDDEGSPQFSGNPSTDGLAFQGNCRDSSAPKERGPQNDMGEGFLNSNFQLTTLLSRSLSSPPAGARAGPW